MTRDGATAVPSVLVARLEMLSVRAAAAVSSLLEWAGTSEIWRSPAADLPSALLPVADDVDPFRFRARRRGGLLEVDLPVEDCAFRTSDRHLDLYGRIGLPMTVQVALVGRLLHEIVDLGPMFASTKILSVEGRAADGSGLCVIRCDCERINFDRLANGMLAERC